MYNPHGKIGAPILQRMTLNMRNIIYCIWCEKCRLLYVGETGQTLLERLKQHIYSIERNRLGTPLVLHFQTHTLQHLSIMGLQTCVTWTEGQRKRYERIWISRLRTQHPQSLKAAWSAPFKLYWQLLLSLCNACHDNKSWRGTFWGYIYIYI